MAATALLKRKPNPSDADIEAAMNGNLCRCRTYNRIRTAIRQVVAQRGGKKA
jgi:isoquinoline 1-oxidoreductase alpha subunit